MNATPWPRIGFIGCGTHATANLYPVLRFARCELVAVCDLDESLAARNTRLFGGRRHYTDYRRMLDDGGLDAVMVVGPPELHYKAGGEALKRGLHVFVEKPTASSLEQTRELLELARLHERVLMTGFVKCFGMPTLKIKQMLDSGEFHPTMALLKYGHWASVDLRNMLLFMSVHPLNLAVHLFGPVQELQVMPRRTRRTVSLAVTLRHVDGVVSQLMLDSAQPRIQERMEVSGELAGGNAIFVVDNVQQLELHREGQNGIDVLAPSLQEIDPRFDLADIQVWRPDFGLPNMGQTRQFFQGFAAEVREFADCIVEKRACRQAPAATLETMRLIEEITRLAGPD